jgi:hypothetical protein
MPESEQNKAVPASLSDRIENHRKEAQSLLKQGGEQPQYEFKRLVSLSRENLEDRLDFVKLMQAVANSETSAERCIVIGGDAREKKFYPVTNTEEFDAANLSKILGSYLDPQPLFQSYRVTSDDGEAFVLIVLEGNQPRPIVVIKQGQTEKGKTKLEEGDVWIKKNTNTVRANRADLDLMYKLRSEEEAENRARKRFDHFRELIPSAQPLRTSATVLPTFGLIVGPKNELRMFAKELIATSDQSRFAMLMELCRETLVEGWDSTETSVPAADLARFFSTVSDFRTNQFLPALDSVVELGLLGIKHNVSGPWLGAVVELLIESFNASQRLVRFQMHGVVKIEQFPYHWWRPAFDIYVGLRVLANYAVLRNKLHFLGVILPHIVKCVLGNPMFKEAKAPMILWPFRAISFEPGELKAGRAQYFWKDRVASTWGSYFGTLENFFTATSQLELLLEFNSFLGTNQMQDEQYQALLTETNLGQIEFEYVPDLFAQDLQATVPMAQVLFDMLTSKEGLPDYLVIDGRFPLYAPTVLSTMAHQIQQRLEVYGGFLYRLKAWQSRYRRETFGAWGFMWDWPGRLKEIADAFGERQKQQNLNETRQQPPR